MSINEDYFKFLENDEEPQDVVKSKAAEKIQEKIDRFKGSSDPRECKKCND